MNNIEVKVMRVDELRPHPKNPRKHKAKGIDKLVRSIKEFGWTNPVLVSEEGYVLAGHARLKAAKKAGIKEVPVIVLPLSGEKAEAYMIADNRLQDDSDWDEQLLHELVEELKEKIDLAITGLEEKEINVILGEIEKNTDYTSKGETIYYEVKGLKPEIEELVDDSKTKQLVEEIEASKLPKKEKEFLIKAAQRHLVFNYSKIAEYYAHASKEMQELMEKSALVIIDYDKAVANGFVELSKTIERLMKEAKEDAE